MTEPGRTTEGGQYTLADIAPLQQADFLAQLATCGANPHHHYSFASFACFERMVEQTPLDNSETMSEGAQLVYTKLRRVSGWRSVCNVAFAMRWGERLAIQTIKTYCVAAEIPIKPMLVPTDEECVVLMDYVRQVIRLVFQEMPCNHIPLGKWDIGSLGAPLLRRELIHTFVILDDTKVPLSTKTARNWMLLTEECVDPLVDSTTEKRNNQGTCVLV